MTVKQYLYSVRDEQKEIEELNERIYEMRMSLLPGAMRYDVDRVQVSPTDTTADRNAGGDGSATRQKARIRNE